MKTGRESLLCALSLVGLVLAARYEHRGCFTNRHFNLGDTKGTLAKDIILSPNRCLTRCSRSKRQYFVLKESICVCVEDESSYRMSNTSTGCNIACAGESRKTCGGSSAVDLYKVSYYDAIMAPSHGYINQTQYRAFFWCKPGWYLYGQSITYCKRGVDKWDVSQMPMCLKNSSDSFKQLDQTLYNASTLLSKEDTTTKDIENVLQELEKASKEEEYLEEDPSRIELIIQALTFSAQANDSSPKCTELVIATINNFFEIDDEILRKGRNKPSKVIDALEKQVSKLQSGEENFTRILDNVGITAIKINATNHKTFLTFASIVPQNWTHSLEGIMNEKTVLVFESKKGIPTTRTLASVSVHTNIIKELFGDKVMIPVSFFIYRNSKLFVSSSLTEEDRMIPSDTRTITSQVISAKVEGYSVSSTNILKESPVITKFTSNRNVEADETIESRDCVQWNRNQDSGIDYWSKEGCHRLPDEGDLTVCACDRFANFAVLFRVKKKVQNTSVPLYYITMVGSVVSCVCLILCLLTMIAVKKLRSKTPTQIHINLCISLLGLYTAFLAGGKTKNDQLMCAVISALTHFFSLATIAWMSAEAINMYFMFVKMDRKGSPHFIKISCLLCYGCPATATALVATLDKLSTYDSITYCFIQPGPSLYFGFMAEAAVLLVLNFFIFSGIFRKMLCRPLMASKQHVRRTEIITRVRHGILVWFLFGLSWIFGFLSAADSKTLLFDYIYCIFIASQGPLMFLLLCVANPELRNNLAKCFGDPLSDTPKPTSDWNLTRTAREGQAVLGDGI